MPTAPETGLLVQRAVYAGLDALRAVLPLDLCAYVHVTPGLGPQLYLRAPDLAAMDATDAFTLFSALRDTLEAEASPERVVHVGGYVALTVPTEGPRSRGLYVVGRRERALEPAEEDVTARLCEAIGAACHALEAGVADTDEAEHATAPVRVVVEVVDGVARAEVAVPLEDGVGVGHGEAPSPTAAVALAALDALQPSLKLAAASDDEIAGERAVLVLVRDEDGHSALGAALCGNDPLHATASAALQAAERLR